MIDTFVNSVYVYDDRIVLTFNFKRGTDSLTFDSINHDYSSVIGGDTPPLQKKPNLIFTETTFGFVVSMESLMEFYDRHCGKIS